MVMGLGVVGGVDGDGVVECGVFDFVGGVERRRVLRRGGGVAGGVGGPLGRGPGSVGGGGGRPAAGLGGRQAPGYGRGSAGRVPAPFGAGVRSDLLGPEERVAAVGAGFRAGGRGGGRRPSGGGGGGVGVLGGAGRGGPGAVPGVRRRVATEGWVVAGFVHSTSREGDPQLHTHCLVPNVVRRAGDGRHVAFDAGPLFEWARAAGSIYQNHLQRTLSERLGVGWGPDRHNTREMEGFTRAQLRAFSKRSAQIEAELEAKGAVYDRRRCGCRPTTRRRWPPGRPRTTR